MNQNELDELFGKIKHGDNAEIEKIGESVASKLSYEQQKTIKDAMSDPEYLNSILSSPKAQEIIKKLGGGLK